MTREYYRGKNASLGKILSQYRAYDAVFNENLNPGDILQTSKGNIANQRTQVSADTKKPQVYAEDELEPIHLVVFYDEYPYPEGGEPGPDDDIVSPTFYETEDCYCVRSTQDYSDPNFDDFQSCSNSGFRDHFLYAIPGIYDPLAGQTFADDEDMPGDKCYYSRPGEWFPCETPLEEIPEQTEENLGVLPTREFYQTFSETVFFTTGGEDEALFAQWLADGNSWQNHPYDFNVVGYFGGLFWQIDNSCFKWVSLRNTGLSSCDAPRPAPPVDTSSYTEDVGFANSSGGACTGVTVTLSANTSSGSTQEFSSTNNPRNIIEGAGPEPELGYVFKSPTNKRDFYFYWNSIEPIKFRTLADDQHFEVLGVSLLEEETAIVVLKLTTVKGEDVWHTIEAYDLDTGDLVTAVYDDGSISTRQALEDILQQPVNWQYTLSSSHEETAPEFIFDDIPYKLVTGTQPESTFFEVDLRNYANDIDALMAEEIPYRIFERNNGGGIDILAEDTVEYTPPEGDFIKGEVKILSWSYPGFDLE